MYPRLHFALARSQSCSGHPAGLDLRRQMTKGKLAVVKIMYFANFTETSDHLDTVLGLFLGTGEGTLRVGGPEA